MPTPGYAEMDDAAASAAWINAMCKSDPKAIELQQAKAQNAELLEALHGLLKYMPSNRELELLGADMAPLMLAMRYAQMVWAKGMKREASNG